MINFGIIGAGSIAHAMAGTLSHMKEARAYGIASRSIDKAKQYQKQYHMEKAYGSYEELVTDPEIDVVYIATPHAFHYEQAKLCLEHGKHVLCEKAFTANAKQAEELISLASEKKLFLGEAMWTRFMPIIKKMKEIITEGVIGDVTFLTANLNFPMLQKERLIQPELAGGALLDVGIYPLTIASIVMGDDIEKVVATAVLTDKGMDKMGQYTLVYSNGTMADLNSGMCSFSDGNAVIYGTKGQIILEGTNCPRGFKVLDHTWNLIMDISAEQVADYPCEDTLTGYEYEVRACAEAIENGNREFEQMPLSLTLKMMKLMDEIRSQMGVRYPFED